MLHTITLFEHTAKCTIMCCAFSISYLLSNFKYIYFFVYSCVHFISFYFIFATFLYYFAFGYEYLLLEFVVIAILVFLLFLLFLLFLFAFVIFHFIAFQFPLFMMPWISHYHSVVCLLGLAWFACLHLAFHFSHYVSVHTWRGHSSNSSNSSNELS